jgi:hypothetical protein
MAAATSRKQPANLIRSDTSWVPGISGANELVNLTHGLRCCGAPPSQAVISTTSLFVFLFGAILSIAAPGFGEEDLSTGNLIQKSLSSILVATGAIFIDR